MGNKKFAAFVITFERPEVLKKTIGELLRQTYPPEYILVVDNSHSAETEAEMKNVSSIVGYHRMGDNVGPAGAAKKALEVLSEMGFDWIYWGDDDNPPKDPQVFETHFKRLAEVEMTYGITPGIFGGKGGNLNKLTGRVRSLSNLELVRNNIQEVDVVPGGHTLIVNSAVVREGALPTPKLFFGFEELDFCLKVKRSGFKIFIDAESWLNTRANSGKKNLEYQWKDSRFGDSSLLWRDYYSSRNLLYILLLNGYVLAFGFMFCKIILKSFVGFRYGGKYGVENFRIHWKALFHLFLNRFGKMKN